MPALFPHHLGEAGGQQAAGGIPAHRDAAGIHAQPGRVLEDPAQGGGGVVQRRGPFVFRRQAIIHRDDAKAAFMREQAAEPVMGVQIAHHKAAAMEIDQGRQRLAARRDRGIGAGADRGLPVREW